MSKATRWTGLAMATALSLALPLGASAQDEEAVAQAVIPELGGLDWYRSDDLTGTQMQEALPEEEVADWATLVESVGADFDDLSWTYQQAFDPSALPYIGGIATVRVTGADTLALRDAVAADIRTQIERAGLEAAPAETATIGDKEVVVVVMPEDVGLQDALVYASGDTAWALVMPSDLAEEALEQLP